MPTRASPTIHRSSPAPGSQVGVAEGGVAGPARPPPVRPRTRKPSSTTSAPNRNSQNDRAFSAREGHVRGADLERDDVVRQADRHRRPEQQQHDRAVHREQLVVAPASSTSWRPGAASSARISAASRPPTRNITNADDDVEDADPLVVGRGEPAGQAAHLRMRQGEAAGRRLGKRRVAHDAADGAGGSMPPGPGEAEAAGDADRPAIPRRRVTRQPRLELGPRDRPDREQHAVVVDAAELGALPAVPARLIDREVELGRMARDGVPLEQEGRHVERVDHVVGGQQHVHRFADRHAPSRRAPAASRSP